MWELDESRYEQLEWSGSDLEQNRFGGVCTDPDRCSVNQMESSSQSSCSQAVGQAFLRL
jgi:hypothetical protein